MSRHTARDRALEVARAIIGGRTNLVAGVRELSDLHGEICGDALSPTLLAIQAAAHDTRELRVGLPIHLLSRAETAELQRRIIDAENRHRESVLAACRTLVRKLEKVGSEP